MPCSQNYPRKYKEAQTQHRHLPSTVDYPRVGGEKITDETIGTVIQGSPPQSRENLANIGDDIGDDGSPLLVQELFKLTLPHDSCGIFWHFGRCFNQLCNQLKVAIQFRCCHFIHVLTFFLINFPCKAGKSVPIPAGSHSSKDHPCWHRESTSATPPPAIS